MSIACPEWVQQCRVTSATRNSETPQQAEPSCTSTNNYAVTRRRSATGAEMISKSRNGYGATWHRTCVAPRGKKHTSVTAWVVRTGQRSTLFRPFKKRSSCRGSSILIRAGSPSRSFFIVPQAQRLKLVFFIRIRRLSAFRHDRCTSYPTKMTSLLSHCRVGITADRVKHEATKRH